MLTTDAQTFNLGRAIAALASKRPLPTPEQTESDRIANRVDAIPARGSFFFPLHAPLSVPSRRELNVENTGTVGSFTDSFASQLRSRLILARLGASVTLGLPEAVGNSNGDHLIPMLESVSAGFYAEQATADAGDPSVRPLAASPLRCQANMTVSRAVLRTFEGQNQLVADLVSAVAHEIDRTGLVGAGDDVEPLGLVNNEAVPLVEIAENGGPASRAFLASLIRAVGDENGDTGSLAFVTSPAGRESLAVTETVASSGRYLLSDDGRIQGVPLESTSSLPTDLTQGTGENLTPLLIGPWSSVHVLSWGDPFVMVNPYTFDRENLVRLSVEMLVNCVPRVPEAFRRCLDLETVDS